jgi:competence protein ComEC
LRLAPVLFFDLYADREPSLWLIAPATISLGVGAYLARGHRLAFYVLCGLCALFAGELSAALRTARVAAPAIDRVRIATLDGFIEEIGFLPHRRALHFARPFQ